MLVTKCTAEKTRCYRDPSSFCVSDGCMAWRWHDPQHIRDSQGNTLDGNGFAHNITASRDWLAQPRLGFCGAAGESKYAADGSKPRDIRAGAGDSECNRALSYIEVAQKAFFDRHPQLTRYDMSWDSPLKDKIRRLL